MQRALKSLGLKGEKGFDDAQSDMKEAEGDLDRPGDGEGKPGSSRRTGKGAAVDAQGRALEALRDGATGLQKQMGGQGSSGQGRYQARRGRPGEREGDDFFGRDREGNRGSDYGSLRETGGGAERARRVMEELRRRLADPEPRARRARLPRAPDAMRPGAAGRPLGREALSQFAPPARLSPARPCGIKRFNGSDASRS